MRYIQAIQVSKVIATPAVNGDTLHPDAPIPRLKGGITQKEDLCTALLSKVLLQITRQIHRLQPKGGQ